MVFAEPPSAHQQNATWMVFGEPPSAHQQNATWMVFGEPPSAHQQNATQTAFCLRADGGPITDVYMDHIGLI